MGKGQVLPASGGRLCDRDPGRSSCALTALSGGDFLPGAAGVGGKKWVPAPGPPSLPFSKSSSRIFLSKGFFPLAT